jgi:hypothetical protein
MYSIIGIFAIVFAVLFYFREKFVEGPDERNN